LRDFGGAVAVARELEGDGARVLEPPQLAEDGREVDLAGARDEVLVDAPPGVVDLDVAERGGELREMVVRRAGLGDEEVSDVDGRHQVVAAEPLPQLAVPGV